ncbi:MAG: hypothetical protein SFU87_20855 [Chitinophagaceae bacterium]|nr:hypothetical protein [Chitinophagaceae bacterium]
MNSTKLQPPYQNFAEYIRSVKFVQNAFIAGAGLFGLITIFIVEVMKSTGDFDHLGQVLFIIALTLTVLTFIARKALFPIQVNILGSKAPLRRKLDVYKAAVMVQLALIEAPALFCIIVYLLSGNRLVLLLWLFQLYQLFTTRITPEAVSSTLPLSTAEKMKIDNPEMGID